MDHPYHHQPDRAFWKTAVSERSDDAFDDIYRPRFPITRDMRIATAGSCFAQHIGRQFRERGYNLLDLERRPMGLPAERAHEFGFDLYSARYGNIYTIRQMLQLARRANGRFRPRETLWETGGRAFDPFRPTIEPNGFASAEEVLKDVAYHLGRVRSLLKRTDLFVFTFGLTEAWEAKRDGSVFPVCPGVHAGRFDDAKYRFHNFTFAETLADARAFIKLCLKANRSMRFLFTVSPVPLTATATDDHVLPATVYSKSVLRAVCGELAAAYPQVDYFPSYELVASHPLRGARYLENMRAVSPDGVAKVMDVFFTAHGDTGSVPDRNAADSNRALRKGRGARREDDDEDVDDDDEDIVCDEELLEKFGR